jgi:hypothetical protein
MRVGPSFFQFRYASMSALSLYAGYRAGPVLLVTGMLRNHAGARARVVEYRLVHATVHASRRTARAC